MGPGTKKKKNELPDWMQNAVPVEETEELPSWLAGAELIEEEAPQPRFTDDMIDPYSEAPSGVRFELSGLAKPEDKLAALRKHYPDAEPYGDGNFAMTDPETGKVIVFNQEGWMPSVGDFAEAAPLAAEIGGAIGGGILGGAKGAALGGGGGAVAGSIIPGAGTAVGGVSGATVGGVTGAMGGAGVGGAAMRDLAERGINWYFSNEDTRTLGEYAKDKATDVALNAAGEGVGMAAAKIGSKVIGAPVRKWIAGKGADAAKSTQLADDFAKANIPSTVGTISQNPATLAREAFLAKANPVGRVGEMQGVTDDAISQEFSRITRDLASNTDSALRPSTGQGVGESLMAKAGEANAAVNAQRNALYQNVDNLAGGQVSAGNAKTSELLVRLNSEKKALGASAKLNKGSLLDEAITQTKAASGDIKNMTFGQMQEMRSTIGKMAFDKTTDPYLASRYKDLYKAITDDMAETAKSAGDEAFKAWKQADEFNTGIYGQGSTKENLKRITKSADGETAYRTLNSKIKEGGSGIAKVRKEIEAVGGKAEWDQYAATYVNRMGLNRTADGAEEFSGKKFISEWNKIAPEAKDAMFGGTGRAQYRADLDRLARIVDARFTAKAAKAKEIDVGTRIVGAIADRVTFGATSLASGSWRQYQNRLLTDPKIVKWMTGIPQAQVARGGVGEHFSVLRNMAREGLRAGTEDGKLLSDAITAWLDRAGVKDEEKQ